MPVPPDTFEFLESAKSDLFSIADSDPEAGDRIRNKIEELREQAIVWDRVPQEHLTYLTDSPPGYNFYRQKIGTSGYRVIYEIDGDTMTVVAILPRTDRTYQLETLVDRVDDAE